jgi:hypothetical protein
MNPLRRFALLSIACSSVAAVACGSNDVASSADAGAPVDPLPPRANAPPASPVPPAPPLDAGGDAADDAATGPSCEPLPIDNSAPMTRCSYVGPTATGGTFSAGTYVLGRWAEGARCETPALRTGKMIIEVIGGRTYMRYVQELFPSSTPSLPTISRGTEELTPNGISVYHQEQCHPKGQYIFGYWTGFIATPDEIVFMTPAKRERWVRVPKLVPAIEPEPVLQP